MKNNPKNILEDFTNLTLQFITKTSDTFLRVTLFSELLS